MINLFWMEKVRETLATFKNSLAWQLEILKQGLKVI